MEKKNKFNEIIQGKKPVLVDFYADWCGPCKVMAPILAELKNNMKDNLTVIKVDVDKNPQAANAYQVQGVPTLILFKNGEIRWRQSGVMDLGRLQGIVQQFIEV